MIAWKFWNGPELENVKIILVRMFQLDPRLEMWTEIPSKNFSWIPAGASGRTFDFRFKKCVPLGSDEEGLVVKWEGEVISEVDGATLGEKVKWD